MLPQGGVGGINIFENKVVLKLVCVFRLFDLLEHCERQLQLITGVLLAQNLNFNVIITGLVLLFIGSKFDPFAKIVKLRCSHLQSGIKTSTPESMESQVLYQWSSME